jgi:hypothetical protein
MRSQQETTGAYIICPSQNKGGGLIKGTCKGETGLKDRSDKKATPFRSSKNMLQKFFSHLLTKRGVHGFHSVCN